VVWLYKQEAKPKKIFPVPDCMPDDPLSQKSTSLGKFMFVLGVLLPYYESVFLLYGYFMSFDSQFYVQAICFC